MGFSAVEVSNAAPYVGILFKGFLPESTLGGTGSVALFYAVHAEGLVEVFVLWVCSLIGAVNSEAVSNL